LYLELAGGGFFNDRQIWNYDWIVPNAQVETIASLTPGAVSGANLQSLGLGSQYLDADCLPDGVCWVISWEMSAIVTTNQDFTGLVLRVLCVFFKYAHSS